MNIDDRMNRGFVRLLHLALRLGAGQEVTSEFIRERYGVSRPTATRDLLRLECALPVTVEEDSSGMYSKFPRKTLRLDPLHRGFVKVLRVAAGD